MPLSLRCEIDANPPSEARWERDPDPALSNTTTLPPIHTMSDGSLNFSAITKQDMGWYERMMWPICPLSILLQTIGIAALHRMSLARMHRLAISSMSGQKVGAIKWV